MPSTAKILKFRSRYVESPLNSAEARDLAIELLAVSIDERREEQWHALLSAETLLPALEHLKVRLNSYPAPVFAEAEAFYQRIASPARPIGVFDERDFFLGECAFLAGNSARLLGRFQEAESWYDLAEAAFRHTVNSPANLIRVSHARLVVRYELGRYHEVVCLLPVIRESFERLGMLADVQKARFLEALCFKGLGDSEKSLACFLELEGTIGHYVPSMLPIVLTNIAAEHGRRGDSAAALVAYEKALSLVSQGGDPMASAHLNGTIGEAYRAKNDLRAAIACFRSAISEYSKAGMETRVAYNRIQLAEALLSAERNREAEWEILAALPVLEEQKMVVEAVGAIGLLRESVGRRETNLAAFQQVRSALKPN